MDDDEQLRIILSEAFFTFLESTLLLSEVSMEDSEKQNKAIMGLKAVYEDLFSLGPSERSRADVEKAVRNFTDRHSEMIQNRLTEDAFNGLVDSLCEFIGITKQSIIGP